MFLSWLLAQREKLPKRKKYMFMKYGKYILICAYKSLHSVPISVISSVSMCEDSEMSLELWQSKIK